ncbi:MAG: toll/interleukin-1 receptor domain-containing protein [Phycisphaerales bacterium]
MQHVFISHASADKAVATAVCTALEAAGVSCWIAPRDVKPGLPYPQEIVRGIGECRVLLLLYSAASNSSDMVLRELENATAAKKAILPVKLDDSQPCAEMRFYLGREQWVDARADTIEPHLAAIVAGARALVERAESGGTGGAERASARSPGAGASSAVRHVSRLPRVGCTVQVALMCVTVAGVMFVAWPERKARAPFEASRPVTLPPGKSLAAEVRERAQLPQLEVLESFRGQLVTVSGSLSHPNELELLRDRLRDLGEGVRIEAQVDARAVAREVRAALEKLGLEGVDVNVRARPDEPPREIIVRYKARPGVTRAEVEALARSYFLRPQLVSVVEDP